MNYKKIYQEFIEHRKILPRLNGIDEPYHKHHILPRSLGGNDEEDNLLELTCSDHFFAHLLLAKIHGGKMWYALNLMCGAKEANLNTFRTTRKSYAERLMKFGVIGGRYAPKSDNHSYTFVRLQTNEEIICTKFELCDMFPEINLNNLNHIFCGTKYFSQGFALKGTDYKSSQKYKHNYVSIKIRNNSTLEESWVTREYMKRVLNLDGRIISKLCLGQLKKSHGYSVLEVGE